MNQLANSLTSTDGLPFTVSPSTSYLRLHAQEIGGSWLELTGWFQAEKRHATIRIDFKRCISSRLMALGGEAGLGIGSLSNSNWLAETIALQRKHYPSNVDNFKNMKHFFIRGHDASAEVLAEGFNWSEKGV